MSKILLVAAALAATPMVAFAGDAQTAAVAPTVVEIHNLKFNPTTLTVASGTKVTWVNEDTAPHTVTDKGKVFRSAGLDTKASYSYTFQSPPAFTYTRTTPPPMLGNTIAHPA